MARGAEADAGGTCISKVCREYRRDRDKRLHLKYQLTDGSVRGYWADIEKFHNDRGFKDAFQIIKSYAEQCLKGLAARFGPVPAVPTTKFSAQGGPTTMTSFFRQRKTWRSFGNCQKRTCLSSSDMDLPSGMLF